MQPVKNTKYNILMIISVETKCKLTVPYVKIFFPPEANYCVLAA